MKFAFAVFITLVSLSTLAAPLELSFEDHFQIRHVVLDDKLMHELIRIQPDFDLEARMIAGSRSKKKSLWDDGLREKLQGNGTIIRL